MLSAQEIANYLVTNLDTIATTKPDMYQFSILAEIGKGYDGKKINGMVRTVSPELSPLPAGTVDAKYQFVVELYVSGPTNYRYLAVNALIDEFIKANQSSNVDFGNGKGIVTFSMGAPKGYKIEYGVGEGVPLMFTVSVTYTENAVTSGDKHWLLDGVEIPYLSESVSVEREGIPRKIYTEVYSKILLTGQTKFYSFRIPYESTTFKKLQTEILQADAVNAAVHTLTYYDGVSFTEENPYTSKVSIYRSASSNATRPNASYYEVTFSDVYDSTNKPLKYYLSLIDFPFDMQGDDTRYFDSTEAQTAYFKNKATASTAPFVEIEAPNLDGLVITKQVYRAADPSAVSQFDFISKNYAIIKVVSGSGSTETALYFYYFIENSTIGADGCILVDLKLDSVQTYFFRDDVTFSDCLIERAHLNRFVEDENDPTKVKFVTDPASKIYNAEAGLNFPKRLVSREKLKLRFLSSNADGSNQLIDNWLNENVAYWVHIFISPSQKYETKDGTFNEQEAKMGRTSFFAYENPFKGATNVISYPVYTNALFDSTPSNCKNVIKFYSSWRNNLTGETVKREYVSAYQGREAFEELNKSASYYYSVKISCLPPFDITSVFVNIDDNNNFVIHSSPTHIPNYSTVGAAARIGRIDVMVSQTYDEDSKTTLSLVGGIKTSDSYGVFFGSYQYTEEQSKIALKTKEFSLPENSSILKTDIINAEKPNLAFNPKLNSQNFKELTITASSGDEFAYDIQKLGESSIVFEYSEPITPEITKYYLRVQGGTGLYEDGTDENYMGLVGSNDTSLMFANSQYAEFLANNKNFFLQSNMKIIAGGIKSAFGIGSNIVMGNRAADAGKANVAAGHYSSAIGGGISAGLDIATALIDRSLTIDNMKNAPDQLKNANGNVIFNMFAMDLGLYVEKYSALEGDLKTANDFMNLYGYAFSAIANIKDYANIRMYHNYLKAQLQSINGNLSNVARADLRQRFADGVRFWNQDKVDYSYENYELSLGKAIQFKVDQEVFSTVQGSTWQTFVNSPNNTDGLFTISGKQVCFRGKQVLYKGLIAELTPSSKILVSTYITVNTTS